MYDSSVKEPSGIEYGDTYQFGSFDECLNSFHHHSRQQQVKPQSEEALLGSTTRVGPNQAANALGFSGQATFNPQYCLADVTVQGYTIGVLSSRDQQAKVSAEEWPQCTIKLSFVHSPVELIILKVVDHLSHTTRHSMENCASKIMQKIKLQIP